MKPLRVTLYTRFKAIWPIWSHLFNREGRSLFASHKPQLSGESLRIHTELEQNGVVLTSLEKLFPGEHLLEILQAYTRERQKEGRITKTKKAYLEQIWPVNGPLDLQNPFVTLSLRGEILAIVNSYMKMWSTFRYYTLASTVPVGTNMPAIQSQRWHRDPQEKRMCKMFIYLNDVSEDSGPFMYVRRSTYGKTYGHLFPQTPAGNYPPEEKVNALIDRKDMQVVTGSAGSVIFCDTAGIHRGGHATRNERIMFTAFYAAASYREKPHYHYEQAALDKEHLSDEARYALGDRRFGAAR